MICRVLGLYFIRQITIYRAEKVCASKQKVVWIVRTKRLVYKYFHIHHHHISV